MSQCYNSWGKNIWWKKITLSPDFIFTFYTFSLSSLVRPKYFPHTRLVWLLLTFTFLPDQSGKTPILSPHQTSLVRRWRLIVTRPVWCSPSRLHPMPSCKGMETKVSSVWRTQVRHETEMSERSFYLNISQERSERRTDWDSTFLIIES